MALCLGLYSIFKTPCVLIKAQTGRFWKSLLSLWNELFQFSEYTRLEWLLKHFTVSDVNFFFVLYAFVFLFVLLGVNLYYTIVWSRKLSSHPFEGCIFLERSSCWPDLLLRRSVLYYVFTISFCLLINLILSKAKTGWVLPFLWFS